MASNLPQHSALAIRMSNGDTSWSIEALLAAHIADLLAAANWQRGGGKGPRPKPLERPGKRPDREHYKLVGRPREDLDALLDRYARRR